MIKISKLADYATVILSWLAKHPDQMASTNQIADGTRLPIPTVRKVLKMLNEARLVTSVRGTQGGYELSRQASDITVADIVHAIDGELAMTECSREALLCTRNDFCGLRHNWQYINFLVARLLQQVSLADMEQPLSKMVQLTVINENNHEQ